MTPKAELMLLSYVHSPALFFFSSRKTKLVTLEGSQSLRAPSFVTLQTIEERQVLKNWEDSLSSGKLSSCDSLLTV